MKRERIKMSIIAKNSGNDFPKLPLPEAGTVQAVCCGVWDIGLQPHEYKGEAKIKHDIVIAWELAEIINVTESEYNGKPYMLSKTYTLSLGDMANLRKDLESWRGVPFSDEQIDNGFDVEKLYGANCLVGVKHVEKSGKTYANISAILPIAKGMTKLTPVRTREENAPKWVMEKKAAALEELSATPDPSDDFPEQSQDESPF